MLQQSARATGCTSAHLILKGIRILLSSSKRRRSVISAHPSSAHRFTRIIIAMEILSFSQFCRFYFDLFPSSVKARTRRQKLHLKLHHFFPSSPVCARCTMHIIFGCDKDDAKDNPEEHGKDAEKIEIK